MNKQKIVQITDALSEVNKSMAVLNSALSSGPASYYYDKLIQYYEGCMAASKFKEGERVTLKEDWAGDASGWAHCKHFLKEGEPATVHSVDYVDGQYRYDIIFDNESWIDRHGKKRVVESKHCFCFYQKELRRLR